MPAGARTPNPSRNSGLERPIRTNNEALPFLHCPAGIGNPALPYLQPNRRLRADVFL